MKKFKAYINEVFGDSSKVYEFTATPNGSFASFDADGINYQVRIMAIKGLPDTAEVVFARIFDKKEHEFIPAHSIGIENLNDIGKSIKVINTVIAICKEYNEKNNPLMWAFSAKEPSRVKLYNRMATQLAKDIGMKLIRKTELNHRRSESEEYFYLFHEPNEATDKILGDDEEYRKLKEPITEVFDDPKNIYEYEVYSADGMSFKFDVNGLEYRVEFSYMYGGGMSYRGYSDTAEVSFWVKRSSDGGYYPSYDIENFKDTKKSIKVLNTVIEICKEYNKKHSPVLWSFSAKEPSRIKIYNRLAARLSKIMNLKFIQQQVHNQDDPEEYFYLFSRISPVTDAFLGKNPEYQKIKNENS